MTTKSNTQIRSSSVDGEKTESDGLSEATKEKVLDAMKQEFDDTALLVQYELSEHKPLGCTVEETVVQECNYVFISKLVPGGFAAQAGLQVGDVLVATNGMFGNDDDELSIVVNSGVDQIKSMIGSIPEDQTLHLSIARATDVMEKHEDFLVELCSSNGPSDKEVEGKIQKYLEEGYCDVDSLMDDVEKDDEEDIVADGGDDLVGDMHNLWASELPPPPPIDGNNEQPRETAEKIKPWSSRSSPSGTYVRDPVTGEMKNTDSTDWSNGMGSSSN
ncbi:unnamed protein product [Cylindrotheca closterium]|uniref:PDZ domain-containing protein n=1 Tax=Cylindrotheca closterium TaxID=2856 RepID=A0AAD2FNY0_9STRA|nr:unnamed protein product [Cylindrotheca closterium]